MKKFRVYALPVMEAKEFYIEARDIEDAMRILYYNGDSNAPEYGWQNFRTGKVEVTEVPYLDEYVEKFAMTTEEENEELRAQIKENMDEDDAVLGGDEYA